MLTGQTMPSSRSWQVPAEARRVLVVDDDANILRMLQRNLSTFGYEVATGCAEEALNFIITERFRAILLDVNMPGLNGLDLLSVIRAHDSRVPVLMLTGETGQSTAIDALNLGADAFIRKPAPPAVIAGHIETAIRRKALRHSDTPGRNFDLTLQGLWMAYQPIIEVATGATLAYEALVRSDDPSCSGAMAIIDGAERTDRVLELGYTIRQTVAADAANSSFGRDLFVNVNSRELFDPNFLRKSDVLSPLAARIVFEITERENLHGTGNIREHLRAIRERGFRIAVDDLGAGYAGLSTLVLIEPDLVKLDMTLARGINESNTQQKVVGSIVQLCASLGIKVVAEGIETEQERQCMSFLGVDYLQGYLLGKPARGLPA